MTPAPRGALRRRWRAPVLVLVLGLLVSCGGSRPAADPARGGTDGRVGGPVPLSQTGFVSHDGTRFTLGGRPIPLVGMNVYNAASTGNCWYDMRRGFATTLETLAGDTPGAPAGVVRVWFFQSLATVRGRRDWTQFDRVLATAAQQGFKVIPVLTDQWGACEDGEYKSRTWYETGYTEARGGLASYREWAAEVVSRYRDDPTVALWSLVNESEAAESRTGTCGRSAFAALDAFTDDMAAVVKAADPHHLLGLGTIGEGQCGASGSEFPRLHDSPLVDVCEIHDYDEPERPLPGDPTNGLVTRLAECAALRKPLFTGEAGLDPRAVGGLERRAALLGEKLTAQTEAGVAGFLAWGWAAPGQVSGDPYGIGPDDPVLAVLRADR